MAKSEEGRGLLGSGRVKFRTGDGRAGWTEDGNEGWDAIHVGAAAAELHQTLVDQLRSPGRLFIPVADEDGSGNQYIWTVDKKEDGTVVKEKKFGVSIHAVSSSEQASLALRL
ncbi:protein-L-isoaspartate O-methyltransferase like [Verticillium longisporum]|nr:protein-L-isoaspartate O-methyltransferase like [Verticillium longisporum]